MSTTLRSCGTANRDLSKPMRRAALRWVGMLLLNKHDLTIEVESGGPRRHTVQTLDAGSGTHKSALVIF